MKMFYFIGILHSIILFLSYIFDELYNDQEM